MPPVFVGRGRELIDLTSLVADNGQSCIIVGEPRIGKTTLLRHLQTSEALGAEPQFILSYASAHALGANVEELRLWTELLQPLLATPHAAATRACLQRPFDRAAVARLLAGIEAQGQRLVVLLDELDHLVEDRAAGGRDLFAGLRALLTASPGALVIVATSRRTYGELGQICIGHGGSPYFNTFRDLPLGAFSGAETEELLTQYGAGLTADDRAFIHALSGGYPFLVRFAADFLVRAEGSEPARRRAAGLTVHREASATLDDIWRRWPPLTRQVFAGVAVEHLGALGACCGIGAVADPETYPDELVALEERGFLTPAPHRLRAVAFLRWCALKLRGAADSAREWTRWLDGEGWTRKRSLWESLRPRVVSVRTDLDTLLGVSVVTGSEQPPPPIPVRIFFSYAPEDAALAAHLRAHLSALERAQLIALFDARDTVDDRRRPVPSALERAHIILLLISADFIASNYHYDVEAQRARELHAGQRARVVPILLRPFDLGTLWISQLAAIPTSGVAVTASAHPDGAWTQVVSEIRGVVEEVRAAARPPA